VSIAVAFGVSGAIAAALIRVRPLALGVVIDPPTTRGAPSRSAWLTPRLSELARVGAAIGVGLLAVTSPMLAVILVAAVTAGTALRRRGAERTGRNRSELEAIDAMTMLDVCWSAGLGLRESVIELDRLTAAPVWRLPAATLGRGVGFEEVMDRLGRDAPALQRSTTAMARAHRDGGSVRTLVRGHRDDLVRRRRSQLAERSQQLGVLVLLPLTLCILPALVLAVVVPIAADGLTGLSFPL